MNSVKISQQVRLLCFRARHLTGSSLSTSERLYWENKWQLDSTEKVPSLSIGWDTLIKISKYQDLKIILILLSYS